MKKLDRDELLAQLDNLEAIYLVACKIAKTDKILTPYVKQACQQIIEMIQKPEEIPPRLEYDDDGNVIEMGISGRIEQKLGVTNDEFEAEAKKLFERSKQFKVLYDV